MAKSTRKKTSKNNSNNNNKKYIFASVSAIVCLFAAIGAYFLTGNATDSGSGEVVAQIDGKPIYSSQAQEQLNNVIRLQGGLKAPLFSSLDKDKKYVVIKELAAHKVLVEQAKSAGFAKKEDIQKKAEKYQNNLAKNEFIARLVNDQINPEILQEKYAKLVDAVKGKKEYRVRHILAKTEKSAKDIRKKLKKGNFEKIAKSKSLDKESAKNGGDLGYLLSGIMVKEFEDAALKLKKGKISNPVKTKFGWHIIKLEDIRDAQAVPFEQVKPQIAQNLANKILKDYVEDLLNDVEIEIIEAPEAEEKSEG